MKKSLFSIVLLVMVFSMLLGACKPTVETAEPTEAVTEAVVEETEAVVTEEATEEVTEAPTEMAPVTIELWAGGRVTEAAPPPDDWVAYELLLAQGIDLNLTLLPSSMSDQDTKINAAGASNSLPDLFMVNRDTWYKLVQAGLIAKVDDLLPMMPVRTETHYYDADRNKLVTLDGAMYGLADPGALPSTDGLVIRQDWLDNLGLEAPKTLEEFMAVAKAFTYDDPDGNGVDDTYGFGAFIDGSGLTAAGLGPRFDFLFGAYGVTGVWNLESTETFGLNARSTDYMDALGFVKSLQDEGVIHPEWPTMKKDEFRAAWKQGKWGMMIENFAALSTKSNYKDFDTNFPAGEWVAIEPPTGPDGESSTGTIIKSARIYAVSQKAMDEGKGPAIAKLLEWMANEEGYFLLGFGVEGVNYVLTEDGNVSTEGIAPELAYTAKENQPLTQLANMVYVFSDIEMNARYAPHTISDGRVVEPLMFYGAFVGMPWTQSTGAGVINPPANSADFIRFYSENIVAFVLGQQTLDEASWQAFIEGLDSLGAAQLEADALVTLKAAGFLE